MSKLTAGVAFGLCLQELLELLLKYGVVVAVAQDIPVVTAARSPSAAPAEIMEYAR